NDIRAFRRIGFVEGGERAYRAVVYLFHRREGQCAPGRGIRIAARRGGALRRERGAGVPGRVPDERERLVDTTGQGVPAAGGKIVERRVPGLRGRFQAVDFLFVDECDAAAGRGADRGGGQFGGGHAGHPVDQFVGLIHHDHIVFGQDLDPADGI